MTVATLLDMTRLLLDLHMIAGKQRTIEDFASRLRTIRERHARKARFIFLL
ncbi:MAG: hypothetical protein ACSLFL_06160 [Alphaproteobacteria bacterium]